MNFAQRWAGWPDIDEEAAIIADLAPVAEHMRGQGYPLAKIARVTGSPLRAVMAALGIPPAERVANRPTGPGRHDGVGPNAGDDTGHLSGSP